MKRVSCSDAVHRLDDFLDRELSPAELAAVTAHLEECVGCAEHYAVEREVLDCIRARLARLRAPQGLLERVRARLRAADPGAV